MTGLVVLGAELQEPRGSQSRRGHGRSTGLLSAARECSVWVPSPHGSKAQGSVTGRWGLPPDLARPRITFPSFHGKHAVSHQRPVRSSSLGIEGEVPSPAFSETCEI